MLNVNVWNLNGRSCQLDSMRWHVNLVRKTPENKSWICLKLIVWQLNIFCVCSTSVLSSLRPRTCIISLISLSPSWKLPQKGLSPKSERAINSIQTVYFPEGAYKSNSAIDQQGRTMTKPLSNDDILSMFQLRTSTGLFMSTLLISITNVDEIKTEKHNNA